MSSQQACESNQDRPKPASEGAQQQPPPPQQSTQTRAQASKDDNKTEQSTTSFAQRYEIDPQLANRIAILDNFELVILCDDSGSMNIPIHGTTTTRWDELRQVVEIAVDVYAALDSDGVDVYFLNRRPMFKVKDTQKVHEEFRKPPNGLTPMVPVLRSILQTKYMDKAAKKNLLILIATDGVPTNSNGELDLVEFEKVMRNERNPTTYVTFLACTDEAEAISYLNNWDTSMKNIDVVDDYRSELAQIQSKKGANIKFSFGEYLVKALIGSIDQSMDSLDE